MHPLATRLATLSLLICLMAGLPAGPVRAAEAYDNCTGFIDSVPATISTQGVWCLRRDLSTAISTGNAIAIATNNVTIDCNHFKLGGLAAGSGTSAYGIYAYDRQNITVRNCSVRGFIGGINLSGYLAGGHLAERNRLDNNTAEGLSLSGPGSVARDNIIRETGGSTAYTNAFGLFLDEGASAIDNVISGVMPVQGSNGVARGIHSNGADAGAGYSALISGNLVQSVIGDGTGEARGISLGGNAGQIVTGNRLSGTGAGTGVTCSYFGVDSVSGNVVMGFATPLHALCGDDGGNVSR